MKTHSVVVEFAKRHGIKEGIVLTELCRRMSAGGGEAVPFSVPMGKAFFPYMSEKQIRLALDNLKASGAIRAAVAGEASVDRTLSYRIEENAYEYYLAILNIGRVFQYEAGRQPSGGN
jgi:hypothetical protein